MGQFELPELNAMQEIASITSGLSAAERRRVAAWFAEYAAQGDGAGPEVTAVAAPSPRLSVGEGNDGPEVAASRAADASSAEMQGTGETNLEAAAGDSGPDVPTYATFAQLYEATVPRKGAQKAAVAGYWLEAELGQRSWKASEVNKLLKSIGVKVSSVSIVLTNAVKAKDPLVVELARLGDGERSRKTFRLSEAGVAYVEGELGR